MENDDEDRAISKEKAELLLDLVLLVAPLDCEKTLKQSYSSIVNSPGIIIIELLEQK